jgi:long-chain acyl-CoA synthetase
LLRLRHFFAEAMVLKKLRSVFGGRIKTMPCSGAAIRIDLLKFFHAAGIFVNYGYGASETTATVSCFKTDQYEFESCGTIMPGVEVKISDEGEILVKGPTVFKGYYKKPEATARVLNAGWYATGDSGRITAAGNLVMDERIHDIFKTSGGKFVAPQKVELLLCSDPFIEQAVVIGDNRKFITALIVPSIPALEAHFQCDLSDTLTRTEYLKKDTVMTFFENRLIEIQQVLTSYERVVRFTLLNEPFSIENQVLTSTLKIRRKVIASKYHNLVEMMYTQS